MAINFSQLTRYTRWDGSQQKPRFDADDIMDNIADSLMEYGDLQHSLNSLMRRGMEGKNGDGFKGIFDYLKELREKRKQQLQQYNLGSALENIKEQLENIIEEEKQSFSEIEKQQAAEKQQTLANLPEGLAGKLDALQDYHFNSEGAREKFEQLLQELRQNVSKQFFSNMENMIQSMSAGDMERMKNMLQSLNQMLEKHARGDDSGFDDFINEYGDMFGDPPPKNIEQLMKQMQQQMAVSQAMMNSLSPDQRQQLNELFASKLGDPELQFLLNQLGQNLPSGQHMPGYTFSGQEDIDLQSAMEIMKELDAISQLENQMARTRDFDDIKQLDMEQVKKLLGEQATEELKELQELVKELEKAGYINKSGKAWQVSARGSRKIGQSALGEIYKKLKHQKLGDHRAIKQGRLGDRQEESRQHEYGDALDLHIPRTINNAIRRDGKQVPVRLNARDFEVYRNEQQTRTATVLLFDLSWSMAMRGYFTPAKKVAIALQHLIQSQYPKDSLSLIGFSAVASEIRFEELPLVNIDEFNLGTNMQHALLLAEQKLDKEKSASKQIIMISDGEPTAHIEDGFPFFEYPPNPLTITETFKAVRRVSRKNITINSFMLERNPFLRQFMEQVAKINGGKVFYTSPHKLGEYILHDYVAGKKKRVA